VRSTKWRARKNIKHVVRGTSKDITLSLTSLGSIFNAFFTLLSPPIEMVETHRFREHGMSKLSTGGEGRKDGVEASKLSRAKGAGPAGATSVEGSFAMSRKLSWGSNRLDNDGDRLSRTKYPVIFMRSISSVIFEIVYWRQQQPRSWLLCGGMTEGPDSEVRSFEV
jgi:hypothetical protein